MNRAQRRQKAKNTPGYMKGGHEALVARICKNGITPEDLEKEYQKGFQEDYKLASVQMLETCYAALCLGAQDAFRFAQKRCLRLLTATDQHVMRMLGQKELIREVYERMGLRINFEDPFDRIETTEGKVI